jgi:hypothetical protein
VFRANLGSLTVSGQILADPFIASFLGILVGFALSIPDLPVKRARKMGARRMEAMPDGALPAQGIPG